HETVKGESKSQVCVGNFESNKTNYENHDKELGSQPNQKPRKMNFQRKLFSPNNRDNNPFSTLVNDNECFLYHNFGHILAS
ncbi:hypothetical protein, partial [Actinobacillus pleuropneumoniae]